MNLIKIKIIRYLINSLTYDKSIGWKFEFLIDFIHVDLKQIEEQYKKQKNGSI